MDASMENMPRSKRLRDVLAVMETVIPFVGILVAQHYITEQQSAAFVAAYRRAIL